MSALRVLSPGPLTSVQDLGRFGAQHLGVPVSGALDPVSLRLANLLAGNDEGAGALEIFGAGFVGEVVAESARLAVAGADARATPPPFRSATLMRGAQIRVSSGDASVCYLAVEGGFALPIVMGSQSTYMRAGLGGFRGRALRAGDELPLNRQASSARPERAMPRPGFAQPDAFRVIPGPQNDHFDEDAIAALLSATFTVSHQSDRMGYRLTGAPLRHARGFNIVSDGIPAGAIQIPGSGEPVVLLADRQTTGGYPKIATVISADLPAFGRLRAGDRVAFRAVALDEARAARQHEAEWFARQHAAIARAEAQPVIDTEALLEENLIGGVVDAVEPPD